MWGTNKQSKAETNQQTLDSEHRTKDCRKGAEGMYGERYSTLVVSTVEIYIWRGKNVLL